MKMKVFEEEVSDDFKPLAEMIRDGIEDVANYLDLEPDEEISIVTKNGEGFYAKDCRLYIIAVPNEVVNEATKDE